MKKYCDELSGTVITYIITLDKSSCRDDIQAYGISAEMAENGRVTCRSYIKDVFCLREEAESFATLLAENGVEPCHLSEIIYDWLSRSREQPEQFSLVHGGCQ